MSLEKSQVNWLVEILPQCKLSTESNQILSHPFFMASPSDKTITNHIATLANDNNVVQVESILAEVNLTNTDISKLYLLVGDPELDFVYQNTTFLSLQEIQKRFKVYQENDQVDILDIGITYHGMGHVNVLTYSPSRRAFFFRMDGGANGYERADYWKYIVNLDTSSLQDKDWYSTKEAFEMLNQPVDRIPLANYNFKL